ncbi:MAG: nuclear transport factor 2 family protein [Burkholderiales bacterium]|nr:nuclear transport factor 2 family protein [Burkholderiales bacterium]
MSTIELAIGHLREPRHARRAAPRPPAPPRVPALPRPASPIKTRILCDYGPDDQAEPRPAAPAAAVVAAAVAAAVPRRLLAAASVCSALAGAGIMYAILTVAARDAAPAAPVAAVPGLSAPVLAASPAPATPPAVSPAVAPPRASTLGAQDLEDAEQAIFGWAAAWSGRDAERYLAAYAAAFVPDRGMNRAAWERARRNRLAGARSIEVTLRNLQVEPVAGERVIARFAQDYSADNYRERGTAKMLVLVREGGQWRIAAETEEARAAAAG